MTLNSLNRHLIIPLLVMLGLAAQSVSASSIKVTIQAPMQETCYKGGVDDVVSLVNKTVALMKEQGASEAFRQIMDPAGGFIKGELYVFVLNLNGTIVANGDGPESVGSSAFMARDQNGIYFIQKMLKQAFANGRGWVKYHWYSPCTGEMASKQVFFKRIGGFVVGAGFYNFPGI